MNIALQKQPVNICLEFTIPLMPPPLSACFTNVRNNGRADTPRYKSWKREIDWVLRMKRGICGTEERPSVNGPLTVTFTVKRPDKRVRDLSNILKAAEDLLTRNFIIKDDSEIHDLRIKWVTDQVFDGMVHIQIIGKRNT